MDIIKVVGIVFRVSHLLGRATVIALQKKEASETQSTPAENCLMLMKQLPNTQEATIHILRSMPATRYTQFKILQSEV